MSPRAFEFFAGDLLEYLGLASVSVTRQTGDGGIDATCELVSGGLIHVPAGVQVKRQRATVTRPEIDRFIGALSNRFACGIFVTTATFAKASLQKAETSVPHISTINGQKVADVLAVGGIGIIPGTDSLDEAYFRIFEDRAQSVETLRIEEAREPYVVTPADDLISLRALSYALRVDTTTIRNWIERGRLHPDASGAPAEREGLYFRRRRIEEIRQAFRVDRAPSTSDMWIEGFLQFVKQGKLNKSYKPVMLLAMLDLVQSDGTVDEDALVHAFRNFYLTRYARGQVAEVAQSPLSQPDQVSLSAVKRLLITCPLDRFIIKGYLNRRADQGLICIRSEIWESLRYQDVIDLRRSVREQIERYYSTISP